MSKIYISYSTEDREFIEVIIANLQKYDHEILTNNDNLKIGSSWNNQLSDLLEIADVILVFLSKNSVTSSFVNIEIGSALTYLKISKSKKIFIPIILDNQEIPITIQHIQVLRAMRDEIDKIVSDIQKIISRSINSMQSNQIMHENKQILNLKYWHMQLHPDNQNWNKELELLKKYSLIGLGKTKSELAYKNFMNMQIGDIVLIKNGSHVIALVKVIGELESLDNNKDADKHLDWFKYRRKIMVLDYASDDMDSFPQPRGTLSVAKKKDTLTYEFIDNWYKKISIQKKSSTITIPTTINITNAKPAFGIEAIAQILSSIVVNLPEKSGMMVGIFGKWGRGKTYLVNKIWEDILLQKTLNYKRVDFSAWKYQDTKESWAYLYETMMNQYLLDDEKDNVFQRFWHKSKKIWKLNLQKHKWFPLISFLGFFIFLIYLNFYEGNIEFVKLMFSTFGFIVSIKLVLLYFSQKTTAIGLFNKYFSKKSYSEYLGLQAEVENELENLVKTWIPNVNDSEKIILFVDDIDRCDIKQIINLIDGLRIILDNDEIHQRLIIITAIDEEILEHALKEKYRNTKEEVFNKIYQEYLEKIFIIGIKLNTLKNVEIKEFLLNIIPEIINQNDETENDETENDETENDETENETETETDETENQLSLNRYNDLIVDLELSIEEQAYLVKSIHNLLNATPRKIRIFYYKYLILKQLFHNKLGEKDLLTEWNKFGNEKLIIDILIHISNQQELNDFQDNLSNDKLFLELKSASEMVSVL